MKIVVFTLWKLVIVNKQLTGLILLCKVFETSSQYSKCLVVLPYQWLVKNSQYKFHASLDFPYCTWCMTSLTFGSIYIQLHKSRTLKAKFKIWITAVAPLSLLFVRKRVLCTTIPSSFLESYSKRKLVAKMQWLSKTFFSAGNRQRVAQLQRRSKQ